MTSMPAAVSRPDSAIEAALVDEHRKTERTLNLFRIIIFGALGTVSVFSELRVFGRVPWPLLLMMAWVACAVLLHFTILRREFSLRLPWVLSATDVVLATVAALGMFRFFQETRPELAFHVLIQQPLLILVVASTAMVRFSWPLAVMAVGLAASGYTLISIIAGQVNPGTAMAVTSMLAFGTLLFYTTRRFKRIMTRIAVELRQIQEERTTSIRSIVSGVAHEMNTPLGALKSNLQITDKAVHIILNVLDSVEGNEIKGRNPKLAKAIAALMAVKSTSSAATDRLVAVVETLSNFTRLDEAETKSVDIREGIEVALALLASDMKEVELQMEMSEVPLLQCRPALLNQVFFNVLKNAVEALEGPGTITVRASMENDTIVVEFEDTGRGIPPSKLKTLFDVTFTNAGGRAKMGFGLLSSHAIVRDHRGALSVQSEAGKGTTVRIELPVPSI